MYQMTKLTKEQAIKATIEKYPLMTEVKAKYYVEEILGYT
jgi:hypothetical protein